MRNSPEKGRGTREYHNDFDPLSGIVALALDQKIGPTSPLDFQPLFLCTVYSVVIGVR
jgi:hypothetical protein